MVSQGGTTSAVSEKENEGSHSLPSHNAVGAAGLKVADDLPAAVHLDAAKNVLGPWKTESARLLQCCVAMDTAQTYQAILPKSGGFRASLKCTHPPTPAPPAPPSALAPPAAVPALRPLRACMKLNPPGEANTCAWLFNSGSSAACFARTSLRMERKRGLLWNELGVGGTAVVVPIARDGLGGTVSR